jgi:hypothetical protein
MLLGSALLTPFYVGTLANHCLSLFVPAKQRPSCDPETRFRGGKRLIIGRVLLSQSNVDQETGSVDGGAFIATRVFYISRFNRYQVTAMTRPHSIADDHRHATAMVFPATHHQKLNSPNRDKALDSPLLRNGFLRLILCCKGFESSAIDYSTVW